MKATILKALGQPLLKDIPEPVPNAGEVLVRVLAAPVATYAQEVFRGERPYPLEEVNSAIRLRTRLRECFSTDGADAVA